ncbi:hypothetical protein T492DRAFT_874266 [Pavlovales sp. CCMP2436]|nr:hypothetical protein T492DRAFT_874266 [Pavlovales sp. CCMP2436]
MVRAGGAHRARRVASEARSAGGATRTCTTIEAAFFWRVLAPTRPPRRPLAPPIVCFPLMISKRVLMKASGDDGVQIFFSEMVLLTFGVIGAYQLSSLLMHPILDHALADGFSALSWEELAIWGLKDAVGLGVGMGGAQLEQQADELSLCLVTATAAWTAVADSAAVAAESGRLSGHMLTDLSVTEKSP